MNTGLLNDSVEFIFLKMDIGEKEMYNKCYLFVRSEKMLLTDSVGKINNVGEQRLKKLNSLGIYTVKDLLEHFPRDYVDRSIITPIAELEPEGLYTIKATFYEAADTYKMNTMFVTKMKVRDDSGVLEIVWFNQPYMKNNFKKNVTYIFTGKVTEKYNRIQMEAPDYEEVTEKELLSGGRIVPIYHSCDKLSQKLLRQIIFEATKNVVETLKDYLPNRVLSPYGLCDFNFAVRNIHFPESDESFFVARKRLVFDELLLTQLNLLKIRGYTKKSNGLIFEPEEGEILKYIPFSLTNAQSKVLEEIKTDISSGFPMNRLVQGDVGSGKTIVAMISAYICIQNGFQTALMAPTEVLAKQHAEYFIKYFSQFGIETVLLSGSLTKKEKRIICEKIRSGEAKMVIGTHAIIQENVEFEKLGLVITDEQHRFGVRQRLALSEKGTNPHILVMTATPIPRTLALILYGDLDISIIDELPPGRQKIETYAVTSAYHNRIYAFVRKEIEKGRQAYIICSTIEESEIKVKQAVLTYTEKLKEIFDVYSVSALHGKMKQVEKQEIMDAFSQGRIDVLVSTTVIEVGINVPNATVMLIENAEQFGLSQLHQLRGRVGRGSEKSFCILISDSRGKVTKERLKIMSKTNDGFVISETDLKLRGQGEFFGTRQHGLPEMKIANLYNDMPILKIVQNIADQICNLESYMTPVERELVFKKVSDYSEFDENNIVL